MRSCLARIGHTLAAAAQNLAASRDGTQKTLLTILLVCLRRVFLRAAAICSQLFLLATRPCDRFGLVLIITASLLTASMANAAVDAFVGWDTTSSSDYALLSRGLTLPSGTAEVDLRMQYVDFDGFNYFGLRPGFAYGVTSALEFGIETLFDLEPDSEWSQQLIPRVLYSLHEGHTVDVAWSGLLILDFDGDDQETLPLIQFGVPVRVKLGNRFALFFGHNAVTWGRVPDDYLKLDLNVGFGIQVDSDFALRFDTQIASLKIAGDSTTSTGYDDVIPLGAHLVFNATRDIDLTAGLILNSADGAGDYLAIDGGFFFRF